MHSIIIFYTYILLFYLAIYFIICNFIYYRFYYRFYCVHIYIYMHNFYYLKDSHLPQPMVTSNPLSVFLGNYFFSIEWTWNPYQKSVWNRCMDLFLGFQFYSIGFYIYPYVSSILFLLQ